MRLKRSQTLTFTFGENDILAYNFLTKSVFHCSRDLLQFLSALDDWLDTEAICELLPEYQPEDVAEILATLISVSALVEEGSPHAASDLAYAQSWKWGLPTALMHFSVQDNPFISLKQAEDHQREVVAETGLVELFKLNCEASLGLPDPVSGKPLMNLMSRRRTIRVAKPEPVTLEQVSDCLFAGLGIVGSRNNCVGELPLSMTPSGGARNPYEAYVLARNVAGLAPGVYHYSAYQHSLERQGDLSDGIIAGLIGGQEWGNDKPCLILLCAHLERTMWKYEDPNAYRVVLIEAGHIGQNIMLTATNYGLSACPTAAIDHSRAKSILGLTKITQAPIYALSLSVPDAQVEQVTSCSL